MNSPAQHPRTAVRQKSFLRGTINVNTCSTFDCVIRDISPQGARLDFSGAVSTPDVFDLHIPQKEQILGASVIWRHGEEIGVAFARLPVVDQPAKANDLAQRVARIEADVDALKRACRKLMPSMMLS